MPRFVAFVPVLLLALAAGGAARAQQFHTPPACWSAPRITHGPWSEQPGERVEIRRGREPAPADAKWTMSPNGAYRMRQLDPDFGAPPPWNTRLVIEAERPELVVLELRNHGNGAAYANWVSEKLVLVRVWWGRVIGADLIVDAETGEIVWKETVRAGEIPFEQSRGKPCPAR
jgi:hypothetical protein